MVNEAEEYAPMTKKSRSDEQREGVVPTDRDEQAHTAKGKKAEEVRGTEKGTVLTGQASANEEEASAEVPAQSRKRRRQEDGGEEEGGGKKGEGRSGIKSTRTDPDSPSNIVKHCKGKLFMPLYVAIALLHLHKAIKLLKSGGIVFCKG